MTIGFLSNQRLNRCLRFELIDQCESLGPQNDM